MEERQSYRPGNRLSAIAKAQAFKSNWSANQKRKPFATEQKPGTGGFTQGISLQQKRLRDAGNEKRRAESFRPEDAISGDIYGKLAT